MPLSAALRLKSSSLPRHPDVRWDKLHRIVDWGRIEWAPSMCDLVVMKVVSGRKDVVTKLTQQSLSEVDTTFLDEQASRRTAFRLTSPSAISLVQANR